MHCETFVSVSQRHLESERQQAIIRNHMAQQSLVTEQQRVARNQDLLRQVRDRTQSYTSVRSYSSTHRVKTHPHVRVYEVLYAPNPLAAQHREAHLRDRDFYSRLRSALESVHAERRDIATLWGDPYLNAVTHWSKLPEHERQRMTRSEPRTPEIVEAIDDARYYINDLSIFSDSPSPAKRFMDEIAVPLMTIGAILTVDALFPPAAVATAPALEIAGATLITRTAVALGVNEAYQQATRLLNEKLKGPEAPESAAGAGRVNPNRDTTVRYHERMVESGRWKRCTGEWRGYFEEIAGKAPRRFKPTFEKAEFEVYERFAGSGRHCGVLRAEGQEAGEVLARLAKGSISRMKW